MLVTVTKKDESVIYRGKIYRHEDTFEVDDIVGESLIERGYVKETGNPAAMDEAEPQEATIEADDLAELPYSELKRIAAQKGLSATGKKQDLLERIIAAESGEDAEVEEYPDELPNTDMPD